MEKEKNDFMVSLNEKQKEINKLNNQISRLQYRIDILQNALMEKAQTIENGYVEVCAEDLAEIWDKNVSFMLDKFSEGDRQSIYEENVYSDAYLYWNKYKAFLGNGAGLNDYFMQNLKDYAEEYLD